MHYFKGKTIFLFLLLSILVGCATNRQIRDFSFYSSSGDKYTLRTLNDDFIKYYDLDITPNIVLILTDRLGNEKYLNQMDYLYEMENVEEKGIIFITASSDQKYSSGYFTDKKTTIDLFKRIKTTFNVTLISKEGKELLESDSPLSTETIEGVFPCQPPPATE